MVTKERKKKLTQLEAIVKRGSYNHPYGPEEERFVSQGKVDVHSMGLPSEYTTEPRKRESIASGAYFGGTAGFLLGGLGGWAKGKPELGAGIGTAAGAAIGALDTYLQNNSGDKHLKNPKYKQILDEYNAKKDDPAFKRKYFAEHELPYLENSEERYVTYTESTPAQVKELQKHYRSLSPYHRDLVNQSLYDYRANSLMHPRVQEGIRSYYWDGDKDDDISAELAKKASKKNHEWDKWKAIDKGITRGMYTGAVLGTMASFPLRNVSGVRGLMYGASIGGAVGGAHAYMAGPDDIGTKIAFYKKAFHKTAFNPALLSDDAIVIANYMKSKGLIHQMPVHKEDEAHKDKFASRKTEVAISAAKKILTTGAWAGAGVAASMYGPEWALGPARDASGGLAESRFNAKRAATAAVTSMLTLRTLSEAPGLVRDMTKSHHNKLSTGIKLVPAGVALGSGYMSYKDNDGKIDYMDVNKDVAKATGLSSLGYNFVHSFENGMFDGAAKDAYDAWISRQKGLLN